MRGVRCPVLVGRASELDAIVRLLSATGDTSTGATPGGRATRAAAGGKATGAAVSGGAVVVMGEAGVGKSRLVAAAADAARSRGRVIARGRAAASSAPTPYRALSEALLSGFRRRPRPDVDELTAAASAVLVPAWADPARAPLAEPSLVLLGEAALTLFEQLGSADGSLVVLEDLHWADPETLGVFEYLVDQLADTGVVVVATIRSGEGSAAERLVRGLAAGRHLELIELDRLGADEVLEMMRASLGSDRLPAELAPLITRTSDGLPLLVEELLAALVDVGGLVRDGDSWQASDGLRPVVPASFADSVDARVDQIPAEERRVLHAAAVLGERFDWRLLAEVAGLDQVEVVEALRAATRLQLIEEDRSSGAFRFRHALTRTALLDSTLGPERAAVAARALPMVLDAGGRRGPVDVEVAADLAVMAGDPECAADLLLDAASRALQRGAVRTAGLAAERAADLPVSHDRTVRAHELLLQAGVMAGDSAGVVAIGDRLLAELDDAEAGDPEADDPRDRGVVAVGDRRRQAHLQLARAAVLSTDWDRARQHLDIVTADVGPGGTAEVSPDGERPDGERPDGEWEVLAAHLALGEHRIDDAEHHAAAALDAAERSGSGALRCEALELVGRATRVRSVDAAEECFQDELVAAVGAGMELWRARALHELGSIDLLRVGPVTRLSAASDLAADIGAPGLRAVTDFHLAVLRYLRFELDEAEVAANRAIRAASLYGLGLLVPTAGMVPGAIAAVRGDRAAAIASFEAAREQSDAEVEATGRGNVLGLAALAVEEREAALEQFSLAEQLAPPGSGVARSPFLGALQLLRALEGSAGEGGAGEGSAGEGSAVEGIGTLGDGGGLNLITDAYLHLAQAVHAGRSGDAVRASELVGTADTALVDAPWFRHVGLRLVAESAIEQGWGEPAAWLRRAVGFFDSAGLEELSRAARSLLRTTGTAVPRRQAPTGALVDLEQYGITRRETDVVVLVAEGLTNKEIAERLYLSPRTVEKHIERLLTKTDMPNRAGLAAFVATRSRT